MYAVFIFLTKSLMDRTVSILETPKTSNYTNEPLFSIMRVFYFQIHLYALLWYEFSFIKRIGKSLH